jgi:hypothetical protein
MYNSHKIKETDFSVVIYADILSFNGHLIGKAENLT